MDITELHYIDGYCLKLTFSDGTSGVADLTQEVRERKAMAPLQERSLFAKAFIEDGTVCWPGGIDLAPERLYAYAHNLRPPTTFEEAKQNELEMSLAEFRKMNNTRQEELAEALAITQGAVSRIEGASSESKIATVRRLIAALGWDLELIAVRGDRRVRIRGI